jgi:hypothetical protein
MEMPGFRKTPLVPNQVIARESVIPPAARFRASPAIKGFALVSLTNWAKAQAHRAAISAVIAVPQKTDLVLIAIIQAKNAPRLIKPSMNIPKEPDNSVKSAPRLASIRGAAAVKRLEIMICDQLKTCV